MTRHVTLNYRTRESINLSGNMTRSHEITHPQIKSQTKIMIIYIVGRDLIKENWANLEWDHADQSGVEVPYLNQSGNAFRGHVFRRIAIFHTKTRMKKRRNLIDILKFAMMRQIYGWCVSSLISTWTWQGTSIKYDTWWNYPLNSSIEQYAIVYFKQ